MGGKRVASHAGLPDSSAYHSNILMTGAGKNEASLNDNKEVDDEGLDMFESFNMFQQAKQKPEQAANRISMADPSKTSTAHQASDAKQFNASDHNSVPPIPNIDKPKRKLTHIEKNL